MCCVTHRFAFCLLNNCWLFLYTDLWHWNLAGLWEQMSKLYENRQRRRWPVLRTRTSSSSTRQLVARRSLTLVRWSAVTGLHLATTSSCLPRSNPMKAATFCWESSANNRRRQSTSFLRLYNYAVFPVTSLTWSRLLEAWKNSLYLLLLPIVCLKC